MSNPIAIINCHILQKIKWLESEIIQVAKNNVKSNQNFCIQIFTQIKDYFVRNNFGGHMKLPISSSSNNSSRGGNSSLSD